MRSCKASAHIPEWRRLEWNAAATTATKAEAGPRKSSAKTDSEKQHKGRPKSSGKPGGERAQCKVTRPPGAHRKGAVPSGHPDREIGCPCRIFRPQPAVIRICGQGFPICSLKMRNCRTARLWGLLNEHNNTME